ncbi:MAG TPA: hypothetical protein VFK06_11365 [Candidatus Angelobacter sp.]|nr:hypothetical protein [Candidatus Angelobacter sp.]
MPEPDIQKIIIEPSAGGTTFSPNSQIINLNDSVFWVNNTDQDHQPAPDGGMNNQWVSQPIQPNSRSSQVVFDTVPPVSFSYHCAIHPNDPTEKGVITVNAAN